MPERTATDDPQPDVAHPDGSATSEAGGPEPDDASFETIADELYALPPDEFVPARDDRVAAAKEAGLDVGRIEKDLTSPEVRATIEENFKLAEAMGMNGTPSYVIGKQIVVGAVGYDSLKEKIGVARCGKASC